MTFLRPEAFFWTVLAVPLVLLYLRRDPWRRHVVASGVLWQKALADRTARTWWLRWRRLASLTANLLVLFAIVAAMAEPPWWRFSAVFAVVVLVAEWRLYQRRWTC